MTGARNQSKRRGMQPARVGAGHFASHWSARKCGIVGFLSAQGKSAQEIADILADGTTAPEIRQRWREWGLPISRARGRRSRLMPCYMSANGAAIVSREASTKGLDPGEYIGRVAEAVARDRLYEAVLDDRRS